MRGDECFLRNNDIHVYGECSFCVGSSSDRVRTSEQSIVCVRRSTQGCQGKRSHQRGPPTSLQAYVRQHHRISVSDGVTLTSPLQEVPVLHVETSLNDLPLKRAEAEPRPTSEMPDKRRRLIFLRYESPENSDVSIVIDRVAQKAQRLIGNQTTNLTGCSLEQSLVVGKSSSTA